MDDLRIEKIKTLMIDLHAQCGDVLFFQPREEKFNLAEELLLGFEDQQKSGEHPEETLIEYAVGCTRHRFKKPMAA